MSPKREKAMELLQTVPENSLETVCTFLQFVNYEDGIRQEKAIKKYTADKHKRQMEVARHPGEYLSSANCMNSNESKMFYYIEKALEKIYPQDFQDYLVFPQVSVHAIVRMNDGIDQKDVNAILHSIMSKNFDFMVCHRMQAGSSSYKFKPTVLIELNGSSHREPIYGKKSLRKTQESDRMKARLSNSLKIPLIFYEITEIQRKDRYGILLAIQKALSPDRLPDRDGYCFYTDAGGSTREPLGLENDTDAGTVL